MADLLIEIQNLAVHRGGVKVLDIPYFSVGRSEYTSLIGPNGAGKSTLLLALMGLIKRSSGTISYQGKAISSAAEHLEFRRRTAMVMQEPLLFNTTVYENVASGLRFRHYALSEIHAKVMASLEHFNLLEMRKRSARKLSGGEARRVSLARAFAVEPELILFDEPFANLDLPTRQSLSYDMDRVMRERGISAILVTHDQSEALRWSKRIVVMDRGGIVQEGPPIEVINNPSNRFVADFVGMETILEGVVRSNDGEQLAILIAGSEINAIGDFDPTEKVYCCICPEDVTVGSTEPDRTSARNIFPMRVTEIVPIGPYLKLKLCGSFTVSAYVTLESYAALALERGKEVYASFKATSVHLLPRR